MNAASPPGWFPDPERPGQERYWFGTQWSEQRRPAQAPPPSAAPRLARHTGRNIGIVAGALVVLIVIIGVATGSSGKKKTPGSTPVRVVQTTPISAPAAPTTRQVPVPTVPPATPGPHVVLTMSGTGIKESADFVVSRDQWTIAYHYDCSVAGGSGNFIVNPTGVNGTNDFGAEGVNEIGASGTSSSVQHGAGTYYLSVNSECSWELTVTG